MQFLSQLIDSGVDIQQLPDQRAHHHGDNGDQGVVAFQQPRHGDANGHQRQRRHHGSPQPLRQQLPHKHADKAAHHDGPTVDDRTQ